MEDIGVSLLNTEVILFYVICIIKEAEPSFYSKFKRTVDTKPSLIKLVQHLIAHEPFLHKDHNFSALLWADSYSTV